MKSRQKLEMGPSTGIDGFQARGLLEVEDLKRKTNKFGGPVALDKSLKNLKFDVRMTEYNIDNGTITQEDLKAHLAQLPDSAANSEKLDLENESSDDIDIPQPH